METSPGSFRYRMAHGGKAALKTDEVFCFFPSGGLAHGCSQKKSLFFFEKKNQKTFLN